MRGLSESTENRTWQAYRAELYRFILKRVRNKALAEDIVHDVLIKAYTQQAMLKDRRKLRPWLYQITRNAIIDYYRLQKPLETVPDDLMSKEGGRDNPAERELARCLVPLLRELPEPYGRALTLAEFEGFTQREVASTLRLSLSGAKSRVQRARKMLHELLLECCRVELDRRGGIVGYDPSKGCDCCRGMAGQAASAWPEPSRSCGRGASRSRGN